MTRTPAPVLPQEANRHRGGAHVAVALFVAVAGLFLPSLRDGFITYDDPVYVTDNLHVRTGLSWDNLGWAFRSVEASNWHPLTWVSHMADCELYGLHAWGHHLTSVLLHAVNAALLYLALRRMTGAPGKSLVIAGLFGLHPLHVESVAWIAERKDVLSGTFWMLTLGAYALWAQCPLGNRARRCILYAACLCAFALGLLSKTMVVSAPCVLLLLDFWPLQRWGPASTRGRIRLLVEKLPFFALAAATALATFLAQGHGGAVQTTGDFPLSVRVANALLAYVDYLVKCAVPTRLAIFYPYFAQQPPLWKSTLAALGLAAVTGAVLAARRSRPFLAVGWLWFLGTLVPVIGLVQVGGQSMADRYTYIPLIGIFIMVAWAGAEGLERFAPKWAGPAVAAALLAACAAGTLHQLAYWRDGRTLFTHALAVTQDNWVAHANLGATDLREGAPGADAQFKATVDILSRFAETHNAQGLAIEREPGGAQRAIEEFRTAVRIMPDLADTHNNLGAVLATTPGGLPEALAQFRLAVRLDPRLADAHYNLGAALLRVWGGRQEALLELRAAVRLNGALAEAHLSLAGALAGDPAQQDEAIQEFEAAVRLEPDSYAAQMGLGTALAGISNRAPEAAGHLRAAVRLRPQSAQAHYNLALVLGSVPGGEAEALAHYEEAVRLRPSYYQAQFNLGILLARTPGRAAEAASHFEAALRAKPDLDAARVMIERLGAGGGMEAR